VYNLATKHCTSAYVALEYLAMLLGVAKINDEVRLASSDKFDLRDQDSMKS